MLRKIGPLVVGLGVLISMSACGGDDTTGGAGNSTGTGGSSGTGGGSGTGGSSATGGSSGGTGGSLPDASTGAGGGTGGSTGTGGTTGTGGSAGGGSTGTGGVRDSGADSDAAAVSPLFSFFVTSTGTGASGGNLNGLTGADQKCQSLAAAVGAGGKTWRAYLSVSAAADGGGAVNARDRIGSGPWYNVKGALIAQNLTTLHEEGDAGMNGITGATGLDEHGNAVTTGGDSGGTNQHDIMTGSMADGRAFPAVPDLTCAGWTSSQAAPPPVPADAATDAASDASPSDAAVIPGPRAQVGHVNRTGTNLPPLNASWNSSHATPGCAQADITQVGGAGRIYCFAVASSNAGDL
jgi:hypothetical protein